MSTVYILELATRSIWSYVAPLSRILSPRTIYIDKIKAQLFLGSLTLDSDKGHIPMSKDNLWEA